MSTAKEIFDISVGLKMRETLLIPVHNRKQQESLRVGLSYNRRIFQESVDADFDIIISKKTQGSNYYVGITKMPKITTGIILSPEGTEARKITIGPKPTPIVDPDELQLDADERMRKAMREDGYSEEDIEAYFQGKADLEME